MGVETDIAVIRTDVGYIKQSIEEIKSTLEKSEERVNRVLKLDDSAKFPNSVLYTGHNNGLEADKVDGWHAGQLMPVGSIIAFAASSPPSGWLECNGAAVSRTTYSALFSVIGTTFGAGDGSTTFNLPDLRGYFVRGWAHDGSVDSGRVFGSVQQDSVGRHKHTLPAGTGNAAYPSGSGIVPGSGLETSDGSNSSMPTGTETRPKNLALMYIIKY